MSTKNIWILSSIGQTLNRYLSVYRTDQVLRLYSKSKYGKIAKKLYNFSKYNQIKIDDFSLMFFLINENNQDMIKELLKLPYKQDILSDANNQFKMNPGFFALVNGKFDTLSVLKESGVNLFDSGHEGNGALHLCCFYNNLEALKYALDLKCDVNLQNLNGDTPLHFAIMKENKEMVELLIEKGAKLDITNKNGNFPLHEAVITGNLEIVKLLAPSLERIRSLQKEYDVVHLAAQQQDSEILELFLKDRKSYVNIIDNEKRKALPIHYAVIAKSYRCVRLLKQFGALVNAQDIHGNTPMHLAVGNEDVDMCKLLHESGANAKLKNHDHLSAIDMCFTSNSKSLLAYFRTLPNYADMFRVQNNQSEGNRARLLYFTQT